MSLTGRNSTALATVLMIAVVLPGPAHAAPARAPHASPWQPADAATRAHVQNWMERSCTGWSPNLGQVADEQGHPVSDVLYSTSAGNARVYVTTKGLRYFFVSPEPETDHEPGDEARRGARPVDWARVDLELEGAAIRPAQARPRNVVTERGVENFYLPQCPGGVLDVPAYDEVEFPEVYPGIDWVVRGAPGGPAQHDFVVRPGADPSRIRLAYQGASAIEVSDDGQTLRVRTALGEVREGALRCTQEGGARVVGARFVREGGVVTVKVDDYVRTEPLVIDPPLVWSTYYGGSNYDGSFTIYCDNTNQMIYAVGYTASNNLPLLAGGYYQGTAGGNVDGAIWKFNQLGVRQWVTYYGGGSYDACTDAVVDGLGNVYVCGSTGSSDFPVQFLSGAYNQSFGGDVDGFLLKFNALGTRQWATFYGGTATDYLNSIAVDPAGRIYACGQTTSADLTVVDPGGAYYDNSYNLGDDCFVVRFGTLGSLEWATYLGGGATDNANGITVGAGNLYVTGYTWSTDFPTMNPGGGAYYQPALDGQQDGFIARFSLAGARSWSTFYGGGDFDFADDAVVTGSGSVVVAGLTKSTDLPVWNPGGGAYYDASGGGNFDFFLAEFTAAAVPVWGTYFGGSGDEDAQRPEAKRLTIDAQGQLFLTGATSSSDFPIVTPVGSYVDNTWGGSIDVILARFGSNRALTWSTYFGTSDTDFGTGVAVGAGGCLFATGESWEPGPMVTVDPGFSAYYDATNNGTDDVYFLKFCPPNSACCIDNNCVMVSTQSQCLAMGGTAFYAGQPCSTTTCTILCSICGRKFHDLNRNGVQDAGEAGLSGWTIELRIPSGPVYATAVTGANGDYCFSNIPCGAWEVAEQHQPGWVQTWPTTPVHSVTLGTGTTQNGVNFGNVECVSGAPCIPWPTGLAAWWPFSDYPGSFSATDVTHPSPARNVASLHGAAALDSATLCVSGSGDYATVASADQLGLDFGAGAFSIAVWVNVTGGITGMRGIVEKRALLSGLGDMRGWSLALDGQRAVLNLGTGGAPQVVTGPVVTPGAWTHLAVVIDRPSGHGHWYLNGDPAPTFDFVPAAGSVTSSADLEIGRIGPDFGTGAGLHGCIADLALFATPLSPADVNKAWLPGPIGFCSEYALMPQVTTFCDGQTSRQVCFNICNNNATAQTYQWSLAGLPAGAGCSVAGPTQFSLASGTIVVPPVSCSPTICVTITRPTGFTAQNATACFALTFANAATGRCQTRTAKLRADNSCWCATMPAGAVTVPARVAAGTSISIPVGLPCDPIGRLGYRLRPEWLDSEHPDPVALSLNGLPPGTPVIGELDASSGVPPSIDFVARYPNGYDPAAIYEIVLEADTDGDGVPERLGGAIVTPRYDASGNLDAVPPGVVDAPPALHVSPNPFFGRTRIELVLPRAGVIDVGVFDLGGRRVRTLISGPIAAGVRPLDWSGHDGDDRALPAGVYFVKARGAGVKLESKIVKLR